MNSEAENANYNEEFWREQLAHPDWYIRLEDFLKQEIFPVEHDNPELMARRHKFFSIVEDMLRNGQIPIAQEGTDVDSEREPLDMVIIHHTEEDPNISLDRLNAIGFVRQYALNYLNDDVWGRKGLKGQPIWSGHFRDFGDGKGKRMTFFAYHFLIRPDGTAEKLLEDSEVGHHAKDLNPNSVGISLSGDYEHSTPPVEQIEAAAQTIRDNYSFVNRARILGHLEVMQGRTCPGDQFLGDSGWKSTLLENVRKE